jgi:hypothetical protein
MFFDESWLGNFLILSKTVSRTIPRYGLFRDRHTSFGSGPALIFSFIGTGAFVELEVALHSTSPPSKSWVAAMLGQVTHSWSTFSTISVKISRRSSYLIPWIQIWIVNSAVQESLRIKPLRRRHTSKAWWLSLNRRMGCTRVVSCLVYSMPSDNEDGRRCRVQDFVVRWGWSGVRYPTR